MLHVKFLPTVTIAATVTPADLAELGMTDEQAYLIYAIGIEKLATW